MKKSILILFIAFANLACLGNYAYADSNVPTKDDIIIIKSNNGLSTNYKISKDFTSNMQNPSKYLNLQDKTEILAKLDDLIKNHEIIKFIEAFQLIDQTTILTKKEKINWITKNVSNVPTPFFLLNSFYVSFYDKKRASEWYTFYKVRSSIDINRCKDQTSVSGLNILEGYLIPKIMQNVFSNCASLSDEEFKKAIVLWVKTGYKNVLHMHKKHPTNIVYPYWIANHGSAKWKILLSPSSNQKLVLFKPKNTWKQIEEKIIKDVKRDVNKCN